MFWLLFRKSIRVLAGPTVVRLSLKLMVPLPAVLARLKLPSGVTWSTLPKTWAWTAHCWLPELGEKLTTIFPGPLMSAMGA